MRTPLFFLIDVDQFFVAVERIHNSALKNKPVAVSGGREGTGIALSVSYEARHYGVKVGMQIHEARKLCPDLIPVPAKSSRYMEVSERVYQRFSEFTDLVEPISVDEAYLEVSDALRLYGGVDSMAMKIKKRILDTEKITVSVGAGANKLLAKVACDMHKPDGYTYLQPENYWEVWRKLPVGNLFGIGHALEKYLHKLGVYTAEELANFPESVLRRKYGIMGSQLIQVARGIRDSKLIIADKMPDEKSMGHEYTFRYNVADPQVVYGSLDLLCSRVARRMRSKGMVGKTISVHVRYYDFESNNRSHKLKEYIELDCDIFIAAHLIMKEIYDESHPVRLVGITMSDLTRKSKLMQTELFVPQKSPNRLAVICDEIKEKYNPNVVGFASALLNSAPGSAKPGEGKTARTISLGYRPGFSTKID